MAKLVFIFNLFFGAWHGTALAQETPTKKSYWVAKTGIMRTALNSSPLLYDVDGSPPRFGYTFGNSAFQTGLHAELGHEWRLFRSWRVMAGAFYRQYGGSFYRQNNVPVYENRLHYVGVAGLVRFLVLPDDKVSPYFVGGARLGRLVTSPRNEVTERLLYRDQPFTAIDVVPAVGTGLEFPLFKLRFFAEVEYSYGVGSILRSVNQYNSNFSQRAVAFTLGAKF
jgi:hypothetical protein